MAEIHAWITDERIAAETVLSLVGAHEDGAALVFLGIVRNHNEGRAVAGVRYEAYREMAARTLHEIASEAVAAGAARVAAVHRLGDLAVGEVSIAIAVSAPHRAEAFDACRYIIEEVKKRLAIWKEEHYPTGERAWLAGTVPPGSEASDA